MRTSKTTVRVSVGVGVGIGVGDDSDDDGCDGWTRQKENKLLVSPVQGRRRE